MIVAIVCLIGLSIVVVVVETLLAPSSDTHRHSSTLQQKLLSDNASLPENCWRKETFDELEDCQPCSALELKSGSPLACSGAHYRQKIKCKTTGIVYRRCDRAVWLEERHFLEFELCSVGVAVVGLVYTAHRQKTLQDRVMARITQQLAAGV